MIRMTITEGNKIILQGLEIANINQMGIEIMKQGEENVLDVIKKDIYCVNVHSQTISKKIILGEIKIQETINVSIAIKKVISRETALNQRRKNKIEITMMIIIQTKDKKRMILVHLENKMLNLAGKVKWRQRIYGVSLQMIRIT